MAHITIEYSGNLVEQCDIEQFVAELHRTACGHGLLPPDGVRTRAYPAEHYVVADGHPDNAFVAIEVRIGPGRTERERASLLETLMSCADGLLVETPLDVALSVSIDVLHERLNRNGVRAAFAARHGAVRA